MKVNCWDSKKCGRQPGGAHVAGLGVCPAATYRSANTVNGGTNGGRICWALAGTLCGGKVQGGFAQKILSCTVCDFYLKVRAEEGPRLVSFPPH